MSTQFNALVVSEHSDGTFGRAVTQRDVADLPPNDVLIRVRYSSLNYKDALSASGNKGVTKRYPHTPGIDASGVVEEDRSGAFKAGDEVLVTSFDLGMNTPGGFGEYVRVPAGWVVALPRGLSVREAMCFGTAGLTAAIAIWRLRQNDIAPDKGEVLVTGATGGVGSLAVALLAKLGYDVVAATGKADQADYLRRIGASKIIGREEVVDTSPRPMLSGRWAGAVDTVGGDMLAGIIKQLKIQGAVAALGNVGGADLRTSVYPFILRGAALLGADSGNLSMDVRARLWGKLADEWKPESLEVINRECDLSQLSDKIDAILRGQIAGHYVVRL